MPSSDHEQQRLLQEDSSGSDRASTSTSQSRVPDANENSGLHLSLREKLTLVAELLGIEASISYEQLYLLPVLQTLGIPLGLAPMAGLVSGVLGAVVLPILGWLSDRGSNPNSRKRNGVLVCTSLMLLGISFVIVASVLHLHLQSPEVLRKLSDNSSNPGNTDRSLSSEVTPNTINVSNLTNLFDKEQSFGKKANFAQSVKNSSDENVIKGKMPFTAGFAVLGFVVYEFGYDSSSSFTRSWILACSPRSDHTSLLLLGLVMAAVGGISTAALARVDFLSLLNLASKDSDRDGLLRLVVQISVQGAAIAVFLVLGMVSALRSGNRLLSSLQPQKVASNRDNDKNPNAFSGSNWQCSADDSPSSIVAAASREVTNDTKSESAAGTTVKGKSSLKSYETSYKLDESVPQQTEESPAGNTDTPRPHKKRDDWICPVRRFVCKVVFICSAMCFSMGASYMFTYFISDYVGKAVYGGDPRADVDSDDLANYLTGVRTVAWGILVFMVTYLLISLVHTRILAAIGYKVEFVVVQLVTGGCMVLLAVTARIELFFLLCVVAGMHRTCLYGVPYAATNDIIQNEADDEKGGSGRVGMAMSVVTAMIPLAYCILYPWTGLLMEWTGVVSTPLWMGATFCCLAVFSFLFV
ncbi:hypothetical protein BaRGS_00011589 [Batillaria attramentaria]|uniref:Uncharacterized protein n=1 Tax=Batillaria attramentaria TaxID=370345 RepID=A0ABD0LD36_9CAEN